MDVSDTFTRGEMDLTFEALEEFAEALNNGSD